jgi:D-3-phosphoglycerate dehydrogenase
MDILLTEDIDGLPIRALAERHRLHRDPVLFKDKAGLLTALADARTIIVRNQTQLTAEALAAAPNLVGIGRMGVGLDNIDVQAASERGIVVVAPLNANAVSVAELTLGFLLALARRIPYADRSTKAGGWDRKGCTGIELDGKTLLVCGFGRIGRLVAVRAKAFGMRVLAYDPFLQPDAPVLQEAGARLCAPLEPALADADFVTVHSPLTPETRRMFNASAFDTMKRGAFFINVSRGGVVDEPALIAALQSGRLGGAALDVRESEPPAARTALEEMDNVILVPHIGAFTVEAQERTMEAVASDMDRLLRGEAAVNFVNFDRPRRAASP